VLESEPENDEAVSSIKSLVVRAYHKAAKNLHPDKNEGAHECTLDANARKLESCIAAKDALLARVDQLAEDTKLAESLEHQRAAKRPRFDPPEPGCGF
jgi:DnaJ-class molecular chaperone